jgi:hypothetical protein
VRHLLPDSASRTAVNRTAFLLFLPNPLTALVKKFFPLDKNYLLEQAQMLSRGRLVRNLLELVKTQYELKVNPLGLEDSFTIKIRKFELKDDVGSSSLNAFYDNLSGIYRFKHGHNQLDFLWDGTDHLEHYQQEWQETFMRWTRGFCRDELFIQAVLDLTVFFPQNKDANMIENRMNHFIEKHFEVRISKNASGLKLRAATGR